MSVDPKFFRLCALRAAVKLEKYGMVRSGRQRPARTIAAEMLGLPKHATHDEVIAALTEAIEKMHSDSTAAGT